MQTIQTIHIGHLNIVDHLILGIALSPFDDARDDEDTCEIRPVSLNTWDPICQGLQSGDLDAALINLPLAIDLFGAGLDISLVMLTHRAGSRLVGRTDMEKLSDFRGKSLLIPHRLSIQHMLMHKLMADQDLELTLAAPVSENAVCAEAVPMGIMPEMTQNDRDGDIAGFISPDPFACLAIARGHMKPFLTSQALWKDHLCCGLVVRRHLMEDRNRLENIVHRLFRSAAFLDRELTRAQSPDPDIVAAAANFLGQSRECTVRALTDSGVTYTPRLLVPSKAPLDMVQDYMVNTMNLMPSPVDLEGFVVPHFAQTALSELDP